MGASGSDQAIAAILKWSRREGWRERFDAVLAAHLAPACEAAGVAPGELPGLLGAGAHAQLVGCALEDFLTCDFGPDGRNVVDDYLKRRGWKETAAVKRYLQALRHSTLSVYEVLDATPGSHFMVHDLVRGGEPVRVADRLGSKSVARWDRLAARLLPIGGETCMAGGALRLDFDDAAAVVEGIAGLRKELERTLGRRAGRGGVPREALAALPVDEAVLGEAAPLIIGTWLATALEQARGGPPELVNSDGEELVFCEARFPLADPGPAGEVAARLDRLPDVHRDEPGDPAWTWVAAAKASGAKARAAGGKALTFATFDAAGGPVLGSVRLEGKAVVLTANSVERAERGRRMVEEALGALVGPPLASMRTAEQVLAERPPAEGGADAAEEPPLPPEEAEAIMRETLDRHYRGLLGQPVPSLGGKSPRQAARGKAGRQKAAEWLKHLENEAARRARDGHLPAYDFGWMWEELKLADLRR
jgi:hypothetical protein